MTNVQPRTSIRDVALCTVCGQSRSYRRPRNHVYRDDVNCIREVGDLKCSSCSAVTRHALVRGYDGEEVEQRVALGIPTNAGWNHLTDAERQRIQDAYRRNVLQRNPRLAHIWYETVEADAIRLGHPKMRALCGEMVKTPKRAEDTGSVPKRELDPVTYSSARWDGSETDAEGWEYRHCVNCLAVHNHHEMLKRRKKLKELMAAALCEVMDDHQVHRYDDHSRRLIQMLQAVHGEGVTR
ncbi:MAG: hypothetical protein NTW76_02055 [Corynebacteriales bacterium]|nr:hypothetical protein [Mycobacteriales bacterium]